MAAAGASRTTALQGLQCTCGGSHQRGQCAVHHHHSGISKSRSESEELRIEFGQQAAQPGTGRKSEDDASSTITSTNCSSAIRLGVGVAPPSAFSTAICPRCVPICRVSTTCQQNTATPRNTLGSTSPTRASRQSLRDRLVRRLLGAT